MHNSLFIFVSLSFLTESSACKTDQMTQHLENRKETLLYILKNISPTPSEIHINMENIF